MGFRDENHPARWGRPAGTRSSSRLRALGVKRALAVLAVLAFAAGPARPARAADAAAGQRIVGWDGVQIDRVPVLGPWNSGTDRTADGAIASPSPAASESGAWTLRLSVPRCAFQDVAFADSLTGFVAGELGVVYRTTDGGTSWEKIMDLGSPYYWYGVDALSARDAVVAGFQRESGAGLIRWTHDGGATWGPLVVAHPSAWLGRLQFRDPDNGLCASLGGGEALRTEDGGQNAADWKRVVIDPAGPLLGHFSALGDKLLVGGRRVYRSRDGGNTWSALSAADPVADGAAVFVSSSIGFSGGGTIFPASEGWIHRTTDGGEHWSGRLALFPYPVRDLAFADEMHGWAAGGDGVRGGIYLSEDGGRSWSLEIDTRAEMRALATAPSASGTRVWSCGYTSDLEGRVYARRPAPPRPAAVQAREETRESSAVRSCPNPFNPATTLSFVIARPESVLVEIYDPTGRLVRLLRPGLLGAGGHGISWDGRDEAGQRLPSGVFFYRLRTAGEVHGGTLVLVR